jgi:putative transposase
MVSPSQRRKAVMLLRGRLKLSERRACEIVGQPRSTQRYEPKVAADGQLLRPEL